MVSSGHQPEDGTFRVRIIEVKLDGWRRLLRGRRFFDRLHHADSRHRIILCDRKQRCHDMKQMNLRAVVLCKRGCILHCLVGCREEVHRTKNFFDLNHDFSTQVIPGTHPEFLYFRIRGASLELLNWSEEVES